jgi:hypothetical protein
MAMVDWEWGSDASLRRSNKPVPIAWVASHTAHYLLRDSRPVIWLSRHTYAVWGEIRSCNNRYNNLNSGRMAPHRRHKISPTLVVLLYLLVLNWRLTPRAWDN